MHDHESTTLDGARTLAVVAAVYPALSETFVYREALGLEARGWRVHTVSLHRLPSSRCAGHVAPAELTVVGPHTPRTLAKAFAEFAAHPLRSARTLGLALRDSMSPGETMSLISRARVFSLGVLALGVARSLRPLRIGHVHCHFANGPTTLGMYAALQLGVSFSFVGHANDLFDRRSLLVRKLERAAFVSCISEWHKGWYETLCPRAPERYTVIRCGVDVERWRPKQPRRPGPRLRVLSVARLIPKKGIDVLIRALARAARESELDFELRIAGDGPQRDALEALAAELGCSASVRFLGSVANDGIAELMSESDIFALPCRTDRLGDRDGIPVVLMEAMAAELPVVVGDLPTIRELVRDGDTGYLVPSDDIAALAERIVALARHSEDRARVGEAARSAVAAEFGMSTNLDRLEHALQRC